MSSGLALVEAEKRTQSGGLRPEPIQLGYEVGAVRGVFALAAIFGAEERRDAAPTVEPRDRIGGHEEHAGPMLRRLPTVGGVGGDKNMGAVLQTVAAEWVENKVRVSGTVETTTSGWTVEVEADNPGIGGQFDKTLRLKLIATAPEGAAEVITTVPFDSSHSAVEGDTHVHLSLTGAAAIDGSDSVSVAIG